ncbi:hypothetical protein GQ54DRAFT_296581 [Martensiomyces pterosporus]|nr:hypothetical protein GQ54DRAFT_296581 [Martensiomyces pterosporus]
MSLGEDPMRPNNSQQQTQFPQSPKRRRGSSLDDSTVAPSVRHSAEGGLLSIRSLLNSSDGADGEIERSSSRLQISEHKWPASISAMAAAGAAHNSNNNPRSDSTSASGSMSINALTVTKPTESASAQSASPTDIGMHALQFQQMQRRQQHLQPSHHQYHRQRHPHSQYHYQYQHTGQFQQAHDQAKSRLTYLQQEHKQSQAQMPASSTNHRPDSLAAAYAEIPHPVDTSGEFLRNPRIAARVAPSTTGDSTGHATQSTTGNHPTAVDTIPEISRPQPTPYAAPLPSANHQSPYTTHASMIPPDSDAQQQHQINSGCHQRPAQWQQQRQQQQTAQAAAIPRKNSAVHMSDIGDHSRNRTALMQQSTETPRLGHSSAAGYRPAPARLAKSELEQCSSDLRYRPYPEILATTSASALSTRQQALHDDSAIPQPLHSAAGTTAASAGTDTAKPGHSLVDAVGSPQKEPKTKGTDDTQPTSQQQQQQRRRRRTQACEYCHLKKIKCEGDGARCINCIKNDIQCQWGQKRKRGPKPKGTPKSHQVRGPRARDRRVSPLGGSTASSTATIPAIVATTQPSGGSDVSVPLPDSMYLRMDNGNSSLSAVDAAKEIQQLGSASPLHEDEEQNLQPALASDPIPELLRPPPMDKEMAEFYSDRVDPETREAVIYYFDYFYPLCPTFHPSMFIRRIVNGDVDPLLIDAMKATTARVITNKTGRFVDGYALARSVKERILLQLERPTVDFVRVVVVMTLLAGSNGENVAYNSMICLAASLIVRLGWHNLDLYKRPSAESWEEWVDLQIKRRIFWLVYQTDSYQAMLTGRPMSIAESSVYVSAPCSDFEWDVVMHPAGSGAGGAGGAQAGVCDEQLQRRAIVSQTRHRSSQSPSGSSTSSLLQSLKVNPHVIVATGAFSYSFMALCELTAIIARINSFLCDAKASRPSLVSSSTSASSAAGGAVFGAPDGGGGSSVSVFRDGPFPAVDFLDAVPDTGILVHRVKRTVSLISEYPTFVELDNRLEDWKRNLLLPEDLRDDSMPAADISYFGTADHRRFMMRVRYFCLHCYYVPIVIFLHQANRPSFFTEYEQPIEARLKKYAGRRFTGASDSPSPLQQPPLADASRGSVGAGDAGGDSDVALREMLRMAFANTWNEGLLAYDIEAGSWQTCVAASHGLSEHLERNSDFPLERFDQVIPFCIFMSTSVLLRQMRMCKRLLGDHDSSGFASAEEQRRKLAAAGGPQAVNAELARCIKHIKHQWATLKSLGSLWNVEGMEGLLKSMQIDEVANAADLFSSLSL